MRRTILSLLFVPFLNAAAFAWNVTGHEIVAAEAYDILKKDNPETIGKVCAIIKQHPLYEKMMASKLEAVPAEDRDQWLMMIAARLPDDVRRGPAGFSHPTWHYVDFPITPPGDPTAGPQPEVPNALASLAGQLGVLKGANPEGDKAIAITWIEHLVGDLHQPLHCVSLYSRQHPKGDRGGNDTYVRFGDKRTINLHSLWDETLETDYKFKNASGIAAELFARHEFRRAKLTELKNSSPDGWVKENVEVAKHVAHADRTLEGGTADAGQVLPDDYGKLAKASAERRIMLAGYRLANQLLASVK